MDFSDGDVSASEDELQEQFDDSLDEEDAHVSAGDDDAEDPATNPPAAAQQAASNSVEGLRPESTIAAQDALLNGELSTNAALLQLQVSDLLSEIAICRKSNRLSTVQDLVQQLSAVLADLPARVLSSQSDQGAADLISSWGVNTEDISCAVSPPVTVQLVGSWPLNAAAKVPASTAAAAPVVDVAVQMPTSCFHHKDVLNYRYHAKRVLYLSAVAAHLAQPTSSFGAAQQQLAAAHGDPYRPALLLHCNQESLAALLPNTAAAAATAAAGFGAEGLVIRLLPVVGLDAFEVSKLSPDRNNVRWVTGSSSSKKQAEKQQQQQQGEQQQQQELLPTPHYNAGILQDMLLLVNQHCLQQFAAAAGPKFSDALLLLKVWAHQRGLNAHGCIPAASRSSGSSSSSSAAAQSDTFSGYLLAQLLLAAMQQVGLAAAAAMSPMQQLRIVLQLLTEKQYWGAKGAGGIALPRDLTVPLELRLMQQQQQQQVAAAAAPPIAGKVSKDQVKLQQKLQQQLQQLPEPAAAPAVFRKAYEVVVLDSTGHLNLAAYLSKSSLQLAQLAAQRSLQLLDRQDVEADVVYNALFGSGQGLAGVFDYWWTVEVPISNSSSSGSSSGEQQQQQAGDQHPARVLEARIEGLVRQALTTRAVLVKAIRRPATYQVTNQQQQQEQQPRKKHKKADGSSGSSSSSSVFGAVKMCRRVTVGVVVDPVAALRVVDVGPAADDVAAAAKFRALWGNKAELRRFQDGKISEAVVWEGVPPGERHIVPDMAVQHVLLTHLPSGTIVQSSSTALDPLLYPGSTTKSSKGSSTTPTDMTWTTVLPAAAYPSGSTAVQSVAVQIGSSGTSRAAAAETAASRAADAALDSLGKQLRGLDEVVLKVIGVQPLSSVNRHTCCFYPKPHPLAEGSGDGVYGAGDKVARVLEPIEVMVQLEGSGRMPSDPVAFSKTKAALGVQLASSLTAACGAAVTATEEALEVLWQGFAFKLMLFMDRDNPMLAAAAAAAGSSNGATTPSHAMPLPLLLSHHHGLISSLEASHAAYGPTVRVAKRWLGVHLLLGPHQLCDEVVELLVGAVFQGPRVTPPPASRISGVLLFLDLLVSHPWSAAPLVVDPQGELGQQKRRVIQAEFESLQAAGAAPGMFIATPYDLTSSRWTSKCPSAAVVHHLVSQARTAAQQISQLLLLGPEAPVAQQQLQLIQASSNKTRKKSSDTVAAAAAAGVDAHVQQQQQQQREMAALAAAWRVASGPNLSGFDVWIVLRKEAVPFGSRTDSLAAQQLDLLLTQQKQQQRMLLLAASAAAPGSGSSSKRGQKKRQKLAGGKRGDDDGDAEDHTAAAAGGGGGDGVLSELLLSGGGDDAVVPKSARAVLRNIPEQVLASKSVTKLRAELLVGFDPINHYVQLCTERYGHVATFCADAVGGFPAVGVKWKAEAFLPAPLKPALAHGVMQVGVTTRVSAAVAAAGSGGRMGKKLKVGGNLSGLVVPNVAQILSELRHLGLGLVQEVVVMQ